jgi:hypothetical protein
MKDYKEYNAQNVLNEVNKLLEKYMFPIPIREVYKQLSIFDWWNDNLSKTHLTQMKMFLENSIRLGFTGYVCFKVGASGCANGMWSYKEESVDGYSPEEDCWLYRSFTPDYIYWSVRIGEKQYPTKDCYNSCKTVKQLEKLLEERK